MNGSRSRTGKSHSSKEKSKRAASNDVEAQSGRALWKGSVSFGLVQIPVSIRTAERPNELAFHQLDRRDQAPIGYDRINKRTGKKVSWSDIVKGYEVSKGHYVVVDDEDFRNANVAATQSIDIQDFVQVKEIPPAYFDRPYHLVPEGKSSKAYAVLRDAMARKGLVAIGRVVIRTRQHLCAVLPRADRLELELLRFQHELREAPARAAAPSQKASPKEVELAEQLIGSMIGSWDPAKYRDTYRDDLLAAIREKAKDGTFEPKNVPGAPALTTDLVSILRESVRAEGKKRSAKKGRARHAPRAA